MKKVSMFIVVAFFVTGCSNSEEYDAYVKKYGHSERYFCSEEGFLMQESMFNTQSTFPNLTLLTNDEDIPIRCNVNKVDVNVKESVATGVLSGSIN